MALIVLPGIGEDWALTPDGSLLFISIPSTREIAVIAGSHNGEPFHVDAVRSILSKIGLPESALQCGAHPPYDMASARELATIEIVDGLMQRSALDDLENDCRWVERHVARVGGVWPTAGFGEGRSPVPTDVSERERPSQPVDDAA